MGTCVSSYGNTMGFSASTEVAEESTRKAVTLFRNLSYKIKYLSRENNIFSSFWTPKRSTKSVGLFGQAVFVFLRSLRQTRGRLSAPTQTCGGIGSMRLGQNAKTYRLSSQSPNPESSNSVAISVFFSVILGLDPRIQNKEVSYSLDLRVKPEDDNKECTEDDNKECSEDNNKGHDRYAGRRVLCLII